MVRTGWLGNGEETVLVVADTEAEAFEEAATAVRAHYTHQQNGKNPNGYWWKTCQAHIDGCDTRERWTAEEITLPWHWETG